MKLVVIGAKGMLGQDLMAACARAGQEAVGFDLPEIDITKKKAVLRVLPRACDWVINCAAFTDVDGAESQSKTAFEINEDGARHVAEWCELHGAGLVHVSTDYVFDGTATRAYIEADEPAPLNEYGKSKLAGEKAIQSCCSRYLIARTQALFGANGKNFVRAILTRLEHNAVPLKVVKDQITCPTNTIHFSEAILRLIQADRQGLVHVSSSGACSWHELAQAIVDRVKPGVEVRAVASAEYKTAARRPAYAVLSKDLYESWTDHTMPDWQAALDLYLKATGYAP